MNLHPHLSAQLAVQRRDELLQAAERGRVVRVAAPCPRPRSVATWLTDRWSQRRAAPVTPGVVIDLPDRADLLASVRICIGGSMRWRRAAQRR